VRCIGRNRIPQGRFDVVHVHIRHILGRLVARSALERYESLKNRKHGGVVPPIVATIGNNMTQDG